MSVLRTVTSGSEIHNRPYKYKLVLFCFVLNSIFNLYVRYVRTYIETQVKSHPSKIMHFEFPIILFGSHWLGFLPSFREISFQKKMLVVPRGNLYCYLCSNVRIVER